MDSCTGVGSPAKERLLMFVRALSCIDKEALQWVVDWCDKRSWSPGGSQ